LRAGWLEPATSIIAAAARASKVGRPAPLQPEQKQKPKPPGQLGSDNKQGQLFTRSSNGAKYDERLEF